MSINKGFFKAKNRELAEMEIISRLGGSSESTEFLCNYILNLAKNDSRMKKFPMALFVHETKPQFSLSDGEMLDGYAVDIKTKKEVGSKYMGSADTVYLHQKEQLSEGMTTPSNIVAIFITRIPSGGKLAWTVDVVGNIQKKIETKSVVPLILKDQTLESAEKVFGKCSNSVNYKFKSVGSFIIEFNRNVNIEKFNEAEYYLGELEVRKPLVEGSNWSFIIFKKEYGLLIKFENSTENISISQFREVEFKMDEFDSDLKRVKRSK